MSLKQAPQEGIAAVPQEGGNEKTMIVDAVMAVKGDMSEEQASDCTRSILANYGEEALKNLVEAVQSGELDDTIERFANGEAGEVTGRAMVLVLTTKYLHPLKVSRMCYLQMESLCSVKRPQMHLKRNMVAGFSTL